jgi:hypothetical protein
MSRVSAANKARSGHSSREPTDLPAQDRHLVPQHQQFSGHCRVAAGEHSEPSEQPNRDQIQKPKTHGR